MYCISFLVYSLLLADEKEINGGWKSEYHNSINNNDIIFPLLNSAIFFSIKFLLPTVNQ